MARSIVEISGHIIDSLILPKILDLIVNLGAEFEILDIQIGHRRADRSHARNPGRLKIRRKVALGNEEEKILGVAREEGIDLVVLSIRKTAFFPYLTARGKFLKMISKFPCPVILNPSFGEPWPTSSVIWRSIFAP